MTGMKMSESVNDARGIIVTRERGKETETQGPSVPTVLCVNAGEKTLLF